MAEMGAVLQQEASDASYLPVYPSSLGSALESGDGEGSAVLNRPPSVGDHAQGHEGGSVKCKKLQTTSQRSSHYA